MKIELDNLEQFSVSLDDYFAKWLFVNQDESLPSLEFQDQIFALTKEAANFLWNYESTIGINCSSKYFKEISTFDSSRVDQQLIKKYLYNLRIPFSNRVFIAMQPDMGFVMTWKMVIKYSDKIFWANDQTVWDRTLDWKLEYNHDGEFTFGRQRLFF